METISIILTFATLGAILFVYASFAIFMIKQRRAKVKCDTSVFLIALGIAFAIEISAIRHSLATDVIKAPQNAKTAQALKTTRMTEQIVSAMTHHYGHIPEGLFGDQNYCRADGYCGIVQHPFNISIYGAGLATIQTSTQSSFSQYIELCAVTFSALSGSDIQFSLEAMAGAFGNAAQNGSFKYGLSGVQIKVSPDLNNIQACQFFKYGQ